MINIPLTKGYTTVVDDGDFEALSQWKWHAFPSPSGKVYAARNSKRVDGRRSHIFMHRILCGTPAGMDTDHINGVTLDNRRCNLRVATRAQNMWNRAPNQRSASPYKGVFWHGQSGKWAASIQVNKRRYHLGLFRNEEEAAATYAARALEEFGEFNVGEK